MFPVAAEARTSLPKVRFVPSEIDICCELYQSWSMASQCWAMSGQFRATLAQVGRTSVNFGSILADAKSSLAKLGRFGEMLVEPDVAAFEPIGRLTVEAIEYSSTQ